MNVDWTIHCDTCGCVSSTVRRDHDNVARCDACYSDRYQDSFGNYDPPDTLLDHLDDQPAPVGTSRSTTLSSPVRP